MLRTTLISRIRKVWSIAFIPRILRGDQSSAVSSAVIRGAHKTTKSTEDGEQASTKNHNDLIHPFSSAAYLRIEHFKNADSTLLGNKTAVDSEQKILTPELPTDNVNKQKVLTAGLQTDNDNKQKILTAGLPLTHRERCQKIIDKAFGKSEDTGPAQALSQQYFSHTVNLDDTRREILESEKAKLKLQEQKSHTDTKSLLADNRSQYSILNTSRELNLSDNTQDEFMISYSASAKKPDLTKNLENVKGTAEETPPVDEPNLYQSKEDFDKCVNNPESKEKKTIGDDDAETIEVVKDDRKPDQYQKATITYQHHVPWFLNVTTGREPTGLTYAKEDVYMDVDDPESLENNALCDDVETIKFDKKTRKYYPYRESLSCNQLHKPEVLDATTNLRSDNAETIKLVQKEGKHDLYLESTPYDQLLTPEVLDATTANQDEELLTQKLETIEETPVVEAHKPKLEGNVIPRVLGNVPTLNFKLPEKTQDSSPNVILPGALDEVSKRCLNCPLGQVDEMLINEMEKLGMKNRIAQRIPSTSMEDNPVQKDEQDIYFNSPKIEEKEAARATDTRLSYIIEQAKVLRHFGETAIDFKPLSYQSEKHNPANEVLRNSGESVLEFEINPVQMDEQKIYSESHELEDKEAERAIDTKLSYLIKQANVLRDSGETAIDFKQFSRMSEENERADDYNTSTTKIECDYLPQEQHMKTTANTYFQKVPYTNFGLPSGKWNQEIKDLPIVDNITQCSNKLYSTEKSLPKPEEDSEKDLSEQLLEQRGLDPYYVLACSETCPISPGTTMFSYQNTDFVDTTETIYMKNNICECIRPQPQPIAKSEQMSEVHPIESELNSETMANMQATDMHDMTTTSDVTRDMPLLNEQISLTELLRRVRERNQLACSQVGAGKCGSKSPNCNPVGPRSPPNNPVPPPSFGLPMVKRMPPVCKPKRKPCNKCSRSTNFPEMPCMLNEGEFCAVKSDVNLTDEVIDSLQNLGQILGVVLRQTKSYVETPLARDYEPWTPIPSWNLPQKTGKKEWQSSPCDKHCPIPPCVKNCPNFPKARVSMKPDPPCNAQPCKGFPKRRSFSMLDCFAVYLGENKVYDLGDF